MDWNEKKDIIIKKIENPFILSNIPKAHIREMDISNFIKRIKPQIEEYKKYNLKYDTPEDWDLSFSKLGGSSKFRTSSSILKRMTWNKFLTKINEGEE